MAWDIVQLLDHSFIAASECPMRANLPLSKYTFPSTIMYTRSFRNLDAIMDVIKGKVFYMQVLVLLNFMPCNTGAGPTEMKAMAIVAINRELRLRCNKKSGAVSPELRRPYSIVRAPQTPQCNAVTTKREGMHERSRHSARRDHTV